MKVNNHRHCDLCGEAISVKNIRCNVCINVDEKLEELKTKAEELTYEDEDYLEEQKDSEEFYKGSPDPRIRHMYIDKHLSKLIEKMKDGKLKRSLMKRHGYDMREFHLMCR